jgi:1-acyl-sn-glycerol-3-phosphate acyltransferase
MHAADDVRAVPPPRDALTLRIYRAAVLAIARALTFIYCRSYSYSGREHVPRTGGVIVVSNHLNNADPPMIARALGRHIVFMAKKEMLDLPLAGALFRWWGTFPVRRGEADMGALRAATEVVRSGRMLMMFPEGTRSRTGGLGRGHPGTAMIALRTGAPILPVAITGTEGIVWPRFFFRPRSVRHVHVTIGEPFTLERPARLNAAAAQAATDEIMRRIAALLPPQYRGVYAAEHPAAEDAVPAPAPR